MFYSRSDICFPGVKSFKIHLMSARKLVTRLLSPNSVVILSGKHLPLGREISNQLGGYSQISVYDSYRNLETEQFPQVIIHLLGFSPASLSETVSHTSQLYDLLNLAYQNNAHLVVVVSNHDTPLKSTALLLVKQFSKNYHLKYTVLEISPQDPLDSAASAVIRKFIPSHTPEKSKPGLGKIKLKKQSFFKILSLKVHGVINKTNLPRLVVPVWVKILVLLIMVPWIVSLILALAFYLSVSCTLSSLERGNFSRTKSCLSFSVSTVRLMKKTLSLSYGSGRLLLSRGYPVQESYSAVLRASEVVSHFTSASDSLSRIWLSVFGAPGNTLDLGMVNSSLTDLNDSVSYLQADLKQLYQASPQPAQVMSDMADLSQNIRKTSSKIQSLLPDLPKFIPESGKQVNYLFLIMDNTEIMPGGGVVDSVALVTLEKGKITEARIMTTKETDSLLKGEVEPPLSFVKATGRNSWYLKDVSWNVDFQETARRAAWFIEKELASPVDVVVGINLNTFKKILGIGGPLQHPGIASPLSTENFITSYLENVQTDPQGTETFISSMLKSMEDYLGELDRPNFNRLLFLLASEFESGQIMIAPVTFSSPALTQSGWSGGVLSSECRSQLDCVLDTFFPVLSNISRNKLDPFITRRTKISTEFTGSKINSSYEIDLNYHPSSQVMSPPDYKNYFRAYFPQETQILQVSLNKQLLSRTDYSVASDRGLKLLSLPVSVPASGGGLLEILTSRVIVSPGPFRYQLLIPGQPGTVPSIVEVNVIYPQNWVSTVYSSPQIASQGLLRYNTHQIGSIHIDVDFFIP